MNLLILKAEELDDDGQFELVGRRHQHLRKVLKLEVGGELRAGVLNGLEGRAVLLSTGIRESRLRFFQEKPGTPQLAKTLLLAIPRPPVLSRCLAHAAALGYGRILLLRANRVEKSHLQSHKLSPQALEESLILGLEQGRRTRLPEVTVHERFRPLVEDQLPELLPEQPRIVAHLAQAEAPQRLASKDYTLAIGPEGGWVPFEIELLKAQGFAAASFGAAPLRVESALSYISGQLDARAPQNF